MPDFKISLVTVVFNAENTIERCINSILEQKFHNIEYIIIDGGSTDNTLQIINKYKDKIDLLISEPDQGIYDAMNKGIALSNGDVVGTLNADDLLADENVLNDVSSVFSSQQIDLLYGDLDYIDQDGKILRKWRSGHYTSGMFNFGWMPAHPTFYCRRELFDKLGNYKLDYGSAADYELMLRFMHTNGNKAAVYYLNRVMVKMGIGGISNKSINNRLRAMRFDLKAMRNNDISIPFITLFLKPLRKILQFFS